MDRRLILELVPGPVFLLGNAMGGLLWAAAAATVATGIALAFRWRWDGRVPLLAVSTLLLALVLTAFGIWFEDEIFVLIRPTVGAIAFAAILGAGALARPSMLERTLDYVLRVEPEAWPLLHAAWISIALLSALANEIARRVFSTDVWAVYNVLSDPVLIGLIWLATRFIAERYWVEEGPPSP